MTKGEQTPAETIGDRVTEVLSGGVIVHDDHRWMEDWRGPRFERWIRQKGEAAVSWLDSQPRRRALIDELAAIDASAPDIRTPQFAGRRLYALVRSSGDATACLVAIPEGSDHPELIMDPSSLPPDLVAELGARSHVSIDWFTPSPDGELIAVALSVDGSEDAALVVVDRGGRRLDRLLVSRVFPMQLSLAGPGGASWCPGGCHLAYLRLQELSPEMDATARYQDAAACVRRIDDIHEELVLARSGINATLRLKPDDWPLLTFGDGGRTFITVAHGSARERSVFVADDVFDTQPSEVAWHQLARPADQVHTWALWNDTWYAGHARAEGWTIRSTDLAGTTSPAHHVLGGEGSTLEEMVPVGDHLVLRTIEDGAAGLHLLTDGGDDGIRIDLPQRVGIAGVTPVSAAATPTVYVLLTDWVRPSAVHRVQLRPLERTVRWPVMGPEQDDDIVRTVDVALATDGTSVPITVIARAGAGRPMPTWLVAYGFFGITLKPIFTPLYAAWIRRGGALAIAHVRGGGDRGQAWYEGGHGLHAERTVLDHLDAARHLVQSGLTSSDRLVSEGTSAGGLTVGGAMARAPELFRAVLLRVSLSHTLRLEMHENGPPNIPEYGTVTTPEGVRALLASDVYSRIESDHDYPPVLMTVGLNDPRVLPWQPAKLAARLHDAGSMVLLRVEELGGHGIGAAASQSLVEAADRLLFALTAIEGGRR